MKKSAVALLITSGLAAALSGCGGGGGSASGAPQPTAMTPPTSTAPPPAPPPTSTRAAATDPIIGAAATSQTFVSDGQYVSGDSGVQVSFDMATGTYRISPNIANSTPSLLYRSENYQPPVGQPWTFFVTENRSPFLIRVSAAATVPEYRYFYSNLAAYVSISPPGGGLTAFGIATPAGSGPSGSTVAYSGLIEGGSTETYADPEGASRGGIQGKVALAFDPAKGTAQITITPVLHLGKDYALSPITRTLTWSNGAATFFQPVVGDAQSKNYPISGHFTGPAAQELIGGASFDYVSPVDGKTQTVGAAFVAKQ